ncbi:MAG: hypothetical protein MAG458_00769 [Nitrosopumilus sp.]|nr:hypothetical protein [Nitrosopumilus sp.]
MEDYQIGSFVMWSVVTGIVMLISGLSYSKFMKKKSSSEI